MSKRNRCIYTLSRLVTPSTRGVLEMPMLGVSTNKKDISNHFETILNDRIARGWKLIRIDYSKPNLDFGDRDIKKATIKKGDIYEYLYLQLWRC